VLFYGKGGFILCLNTTPWWFAGDVEIISSLTRSLKLTSVLTNQNTNAGHCPFSDVYFKQADMAVFMYYNY